MRSRHAQPKWIQIDPKIELSETFGTALKCNLPSSNGAGIDSAGSLVVQTDVSDTDGAIVALFPTSYRTLQT